MRRSRGFRSRRLGRRIGGRMRRRHHLGHSITRRRIGFRRRRGFGYGYGYGYRRYSPFGLYRRRPMVVVGGAAGCVVFIIVMIIIIATTFWQFNMFWPF